MQGKKHLAVCRWRADFSDQRRASVCAFQALAFLLLLGFQQRVGAPLDLMTLNQQHHNLDSSPVET